MQKGPGKWKPPAAADGDKITLEQDVVKKAREDPFKCDQCNLN